MMQKGTQLVSSITSSYLQFELERTGAPLACVAVEHGTLCEGHVTFCVDQDNCIGPKWTGTRDRSKQTQYIILHLRYFANTSIKNEQLVADSVFLKETDGSVKD